MTRPTRCDLASGSRGDRETNGLQEAVKIIDDALVEPVELMALDVLEAAVAADGLEEPAVSGA